MGVPEQVLLASLKVQRPAVQAQLDLGNALDDETRAAMQANLDYLDGQIAVLEGGGKVADLASVPQPEGWEDDATVGPAAPDSDARLIDVDPAGKSTPHLGRMAKVGIAVAILGTVLFVAFFFLTGGFDLLTGGTDDCYVRTPEGWEPANSSACDD